MVRWLLVFVTLGWMTTNAYGFVKYVPLQERMKQIDVPVHPSKRAKVYMPEFIHHYSAGNLIDYKIERNSTGKSLGIEVAQTSTPPTNSNIESASWRVMMGIRPVDTSEEAVSAVIFYVPEKDVDLDYMASRIDEKFFQVPVTVRWWNGPYRLLARLGPVSFGRDHMIFRVELRNLGDSYPITGFQVRDRLARLRKIKQVVEGALGENTIELAHGETITSVIKVEESSGLRRGWTLYLDTPDAIPPATFD